MPCRFGWEYQNACEIDLSFILEELPEAREPVFYEAFLRTGLETLYPVPVKVSNYDDSAGNSADSGMYLTQSSHVKQESAFDLLFSDIVLCGAAAICGVTHSNTRLPRCTAGAVRRFFYLDGALGTSQGSSPPANEFKVIQYPSVFRLEITQRPDNTDEFYPPQIFIT